MHSNKPVTQVIWGSGSLTIVNPLPKMEKFLSYNHKHFEKVPGKRGPQTRFEKVNLFKVLCENPRVIQTYQGFIDAILDITKNCGILPVFHDKRTFFPEPKLKKMKGFRFGQEDMVRKLLAQNRSGLLKAPTRYGKCLAPNELVIMYDGTLREVQHIQPGDLLMGPDSRPREVLSTVRGKDQMVWIVPDKGRPWMCTHDHVLNLRCNYNAHNYKKGATVNITVDEYLKKSNNWRHLHKLWRTGVEFENYGAVYAPYMAGVVLGDGSRDGNVIHDSDPVVLDAIRAWCKAEGLDCAEASGDGCTSMRYSDPQRAWKTKGRATQFRLQFIDSNGSRVIPPYYKCATRADRMQLLAGLLDTDGSTNNGRCYEITVKHATLRDDILFLARSLGLAAYAKPKQVKLAGWNAPRLYWRIAINGKVDEIPVRSKRFKIVRKNTFNACNVGFKVKPAGEQEYAGFDLDGDGLFLLGDFTVTHNTTMMINVLRAFPGVQTVLAAPGVDLLGQLVKELQAGLPGREVKGIFTGSKGKTPSDDITVVSLDSLHKVNADTTQLLIVDEPHTAVSASRAPELLRFQNARIYGFGATLEGRFDKSDKVITGIFGPVLVAKTFKEAIAEGAVCPITAWMVKMKFPPFRSWDRNQAYNSLIFRNHDYNALVKYIVDQVIPADFQTIIFADEVKQIDLMNQFVTDSQVAIAGRMEKKERNELFTEMVKNNVKRCISTDIFATGVTFPHLRVIINAASGGSGITSTQKPGRLAQVQPGKKCGHLIDFLWEPQQSWDEAQQNQTAPWMYVVRDSQNRMATYESLGYNIIVVDEVSQLVID